MVGRQILALLIQVRVLVSEQENNKEEKRGDNIKVCRVIRPDAQSDDWANPGLGTRK